MDRKSTQDYNKDSTGPRFTIPNLSDLISDNNPASFKIASERKISQPQNIFEGVETKKIKLNKLQFKYNSTNYTALDPQKLIEDLKIISSKPQSPELVKKNSSTEKRPETILNQFSPRHVVSSSPITTPRKSITFSTDSITKTLKEVEKNNKKIREDIEEKKKRFYDERSLINDTNSEEISSIDKKCRYLESLNHQLMQELSHKKLEFDNFKVCSTEKFKYLEKECAIKNNLMETLEKENYQSKKIREEYLKIIQNQKFEIENLKNITRTSKIPEEETRNTARTRSCIRKVNLNKKILNSVRTDLKSIKSIFLEFTTIKKSFESDYKSIVSEANKIFQSLKKSSVASETKIKMKQIEINNLEDVLKSINKQKFALQNNSINDNYQIVILKEKIKEHEGNLQEAVKKHQQEISSLKIEHEKHLRSKEEVIKDYQSQLETLNNEKKSILSLVDLKTSECSRLKEDLGSLNAENVELLRNNIAITEESLKQDSKASRLHYSNLNLKSKLKHVNLQNGLINKKYRAMRSQFESASMLNQEIYQKVLELQSIIDAHQTTIPLINSRIMDLETKLKEQSKAFSQRTENFITEKDAFIQTITSENQEYSKKISSLELEINSITKSFKNEKIVLENLLQEKIREIQNFELKILENEEQHAIEKEKLNQTLKENYNLQENIKKNEEEINLLKEDNRNYLAFIENLENIMKDVNKENDAKIQEICKDFELTENMFNKEISSLNQNIILLTHDNDKLNAQVHEYQLKIHDLTKPYEPKLSLTEKSLENFERTQNSLKKTQETSENSSEIVTKSLFESKIQELQEENELLNNILVDKQKTFSIYESKSEEYKSKYNEINSQNEFLIKENHKISIEIEELKSIYQKLIEKNQENLKKQQNDYEERLRILNDLYEEAKISLASFKEEYEKISEEYKGLADENEHLFLELREFQFQNKTSNN